MQTRYTVWEWTEYNGWTLFLGSNVYAMADQMRRALSAYQPQKYYGVYGAYEVTPAHEIIGAWRGYHYSWGWAPTIDVGWIDVYALQKIMTVGVVISAAPGVGSAMPDFIRRDMARMTKPGTTVAGLGNPGKIIGFDLETGRFLEAAAGLGETPSMWPLFGAVAAVTVAALFWKPRAAA